MAVSRFYCKNNTTYRIYDDLMAMIEEADHARRDVCYREDFIGRRLNGWRKAKDAACQPWDEGVAIVEEMIEELAHLRLPKPMDRRRRRR